MPNAIFTPRYRTHRRALTIACALALAAWAATGAPLRWLATIPLPGVHGRIDHFDLDAAGHRLFMSALGNDTVEVFDLARSQRLHTIGGLHEPQGVTYVPQTSRLFVANGGDGVVNLYDGSSYQLLRQIPLGSDADDSRLGAFGHQVVVGFGDSGDAGLAFLDAVTGQKLRVMPLPTHPEGFQLSPAASRIYVNLPEAGNLVEVLDAKSGSVLATWTLGKFHANFPMALDESGHHLFIVCRSPAMLLVLDTDSGHIVAAVPSAAQADDVWYDSAHRRIYVTGGGGFITVVADHGGNRFEKIADVPTAPGGRTSLWAPELNRLFLGVWGRNGAPEQLRIFVVNP